MPFPRITHTPTTSYPRPHTTNASLNLESKMGVSVWLPPACIKGAAVACLFRGVPQYAGIPRGSNDAHVLSVVSLLDGCWTTEVMLPDNLPTSLHEALVVV